MEDGTLRIALGYGGTLGSNPVITEALEEAIEVWSNIWSPYGLSFEHRVIESTFGARLPYPEKDDAVTDIAATIDPDELLLLVGDNIGGEGGLLGIVGSTPGTLLATPRAAVLVSWLEGAGPDGVFSAPEIQLLGETLAHEFGHYMGLYHPVESDYDAWDALDDTIDCSAQDECERILKNNLMFPYPVCEAGDESACVEQTLLSEQQRAVLHQYTGTR